MASNWKVFDQNRRAGESAGVGSTIHLDTAKPETTASVPAYPPGHRSPKNCSPPREIKHQNTKCDNRKHYSNIDELYCAQMLKLPTEQGDTAPRRRHSPDTSPAPHITNRGHAITSGHSTITPERPPREGSGAGRRHAVGKATRPYCDPAPRRTGPQVLAHALAVAGTPRRPSVSG